MADDLPVGEYTVTVEAKGFKKTSVAANTVTAGGRLRVDAAMEVGAVTETVTVVGTPPQQIQFQARSQPPSRISKWEPPPMNQRHYETLVGLVPGASLQSSGLTLPA